MRLSSYLPAFTILFVLATVLFPLYSHAQSLYPIGFLYPIQEDSQPYFFTSSEFSPLQTGAFDDVARLFSDHPLTAINRNPSAINEFAGDGYFYADVKTLPEATQLIRLYPPCAFCIANGFWGPVYKKRQTQESFLSVAGFFRPLENRPMWLGFTYQLLKHSEPYYELQSAPVFYYNGLFNVERLDYLKKEDSFKKSGHFPSLYAGYAFSEALTAGLKVSYNTFNGNGNTFNEHYDQMSDLAPYPLEFDYSRWRTTHYSHWDISGGIKLKLNDQFDAGLSIGFLSGTFRQNGNANAVSDMENNEPVIEDEFFLRESNFTKRNGFDRDEIKLYSTAIVDWQISSKNSISFIFSANTGYQDFEFGEKKRDYSLTQNQYYNSIQELVYSKREGERNILFEGIGTFKSWQHTTGTYFTQSLSNNFILTIGLQGMFNFEMQEYQQVAELNNKILEYEQTADEPGNKIIYSSDGYFKIYVTNRNYAISGYIPVVLSKTFSEFISADLGLLAHRQNIINKKWLSSDDFDTEPQRIEKAANHFNAFGSISIKPTDTINFRLLTFTDRRKIGLYRDVEGLRFRFITEIYF